MWQKKYKPEESEREKDNRARCSRCFVSGSYDFGTPLSRVPVSVYQEGKPNTVIAEADICMRCNWIYSIYPKQHDLGKRVDGFTLRNLLMKGRATVFSIDEVFSGAPENIKAENALHDVTGGTRQPEPEIETGGLF